MITLDLVEYIKSQLNKNVSKNLIISSLSNAGWKLEDIEEGFSNVESTVREPSTIVTPKAEPLKMAESLTIETPLIKEESKKSFDPYREIPENTNQLSEFKTAVMDELKENTNQDNTAKIDTKEEPKVWIPKSIEPKIEEVKKLQEIDSDPFKLSSTLSASTYTEKPNIPPFEGMNLNTDNSIPITPTILAVSKIPTVDNISKMAEVETPKTIDMLQVNNLPESKIVTPDNMMNNQSSFSNTIADVLPKKAMLASYAQDAVSSTEEPAPTKLKSKHILKWILIVLAILVIGGAVFAFIEGYIKIPGTNFNLFAVKKDPKVILLNSPSVISNLKSYKVKTNITISSPALSNITTGLSSGEVVTSRERDSISINTLGQANHVDGKLLFDYLLTIKSSIIENDIVGDLKYDGANLFASIPDVSPLLGKNSPEPSIVSFTPDQINQVIPEFSPKAQNIINKVNFAKILSKDFPENIKAGAGSMFKDFIGSLSYIDKGKENLGGIETYHYELTADRTSTKSFLVAFTDMFIADLPDDQKLNLNEALGSSTISSFEVWIGKNDDNLYQIKFTLNAPLSRILGLNDSGIAGNEVKLDWITTYSDLNTESSITMPTESIGMDQFIKNIRDIKIKNIIATFGPNAKSLHNVVGSYGKKPNTSGSCTNPEQGSLFSPLGHATQSEVAVSDISSTMNTLLAVTNGLGSCYSTTTAWSLSVPLFAQPAKEVTEDQSVNNLYYCVDSTGKINTTDIKATSVVCPEIVTVEDQSKDIPVTSPTISQ